MEKISHYKEGQLKKKKKLVPNLLLKYSIRSRLIRKSPSPNRTREKKVQPHTRQALAISVQHTSISKVSLTNLFWNQESMALPRCICIRSQHTVEKGSGYAPNPRERNNLWVTWTALQLFFWGGKSSTALILIHSNITSFWKRDTMGEKISLRSDLHGYTWRSLDLFILNDRAFHHQGGQGMRKQG